MPARAWLVDLDGTLYRARPVKLAMAAELLTQAPWHAPTLRAFRREHERLRALSLNASAPVPTNAAAGSELADESPFELQLASAAAKTGKPRERLRAIVEEWMVERPGKWLRRFRRHDLIAEIEAFRSQGGKTALVSDYPAQKKLAAMGLTPLFDLVIASGESGAITTLKPNPAGYLHAARTLEVPPAECLVVGDRADADGLAAERAGMQFRLVR